MFHPQGPTFWELARQALSSTRRGYDLLAPKFDYTPFRTPEAILSVVAEYLRSHGAFERGLDICCGTGAASLMLRSVKCGHVVGIDFSRPMLETARRNLESQDSSVPFSLVQGDVLEMPFASRFDVAVCFGALGHFLSREQPCLVQQVAGVLRPRGRFVFVTAEIPPWWTGSYWISRAFNGVMHVRNWLVRPPFVMYYLKFPLPRAMLLLKQQGFDVSVQRGLFPPPYRRACLVDALWSGAEGKGTST